MQYRQLGQTGIQVSEIGFGAWGIGGMTAGATSYGTVADTVAIEALEFAVDQGVSFFDTSNVYGAGHSEELLGKTLAKTRHNLVISSKMGLLNYDQKLEWSEQEMRSSLEGSLRRLKTDYLDVLHLHMVGLDELANDPSIMTTLKTFQQEGKVRALAISLNSPEDALQSIVTDNFTVIQVNFSLLDMRIVTNGFLVTERETQLGIIARTPLNFGFLANNYRQGIKFNEADHRSRWPMSQIRAWINGANELLTVLGIENLDDRQARVNLALKFCLSYSAVSSVLPGMLSKSEVEMNLRAIDSPLFSDETLFAVAEAYASWEKGAMIKSGKRI